MLILSSFRWIFAYAMLLGALALSAGVHAQGFPPGQFPTSQALNPMCQRLEGQLAIIDRGDPARSEQIKRTEAEQSKRQADLDRVTMQAKRMGCDSSGFFSFFNGQSAQCGPVNNQIQQIRASLDQITNSLQQLHGSGNVDRDMQRRPILLALAQNKCGPQYVTAVRNMQSGGFFDNIFGNDNNNISVPDVGAPSGTFRTVCVRSCDGFYFPISFATVASRFADDERSCKSLCPATEANLFTYRNPGEDINQAVSISGQPYSSLPNAFHYRQEFNPSCSCKAPGQTWSDALKNLDEKAAAEQQGDIIVTEDRAKKMSQPIAVSGKSANQKQGAAPATAEPARPAASIDPKPPADTTTNKPIRSVGPTFIPAR